MEKEEYDRLIAEGERRWREKRYVLFGSAVMPGFVLALWLSDHRDRLPEWVDIAVSLCLILGAMWLFAAVSVVLPWMFRVIRRKRR